MTFDFLQTHDIGPCYREPSNEIAEPLVDAVDVEGCNFHCAASAASRFS
jgi:hypothetical protein